MMTKWVHIRALPQQVSQRNGGLEVPSHVPAWGSMVAAGRERLLDGWWVSTMPRMAILLLVMRINLVGERLWDLLDPRLRGGGVT